MYTSSERTVIPDIPSIAIFLQIGQMNLSILKGMMMMMMMMMMMI